MLYYSIKLCQYLRMKEKLCFKKPSRHDPDAVHGFVPRRPVTRSQTRKQRKREDIEETTSSSSVETPNATSKSVTSVSLNPAFSRVPSSHQSDQTFSNNVTLSSSTYLHNVLTKIERSSKEPMSPSTKTSDLTLISANTPPTSTAFDLLSTPTSTLPSSTYSNLHSDWSSNATERNDVNQTSVEKDDYGRMSGGRFCVSEWGMLHLLPPEISQEETEEEGAFTYFCGECQLPGDRTIEKYQF